MGSAIFRCLAVLVYALSLTANPAWALSLADLSNKDTVDGLKAALDKGTQVAVQRLGAENGFFGNDKLKIPLPESLQRVERALRLAGMGKQADELVLRMNRAAEAAVPEAKALFVTAIKQMSVQDAKAILTGGNDSATQYFKRTTSAPLEQKFLPIVKKSMAKVKLAEIYDQYAGKAAQLDLIVVATSTPDYVFPSTACLLQAKLGVKGAAAFDVQAVCSGFVYGLATADNFIRAGRHRTALVVGAEVFSRILDWNDRGTCVLFGDGAGAVVIRAGEGQGGTSDRGILNTKIYSDGRLGNLLYTDGGISSTGTAGKLRMEGREVFKHAVTNIAAAIEASTKEANLQTADIDWFVPHQANQRILDGTARKLGIAAEKVVSTIADHGNTSAASVPLALVAALKDGRIKRGDLLLLEAMGAGFTWGAALIRW